MKKDTEDLGRESIQAYENNEELARSSVFHKLYGNWTAKDFKIAIKYNQGLNAPNDQKWNQNVKISVLKEFYEDHYKGRTRRCEDKELSLTSEDEVML